MNELIVAGILSLIALACMIVTRIPAIIVGFILRRVDHHRMMRPQNVYFRMEV